MKPLIFILAILVQFTFGQGVIHEDFSDGTIGGWNIDPNQGSLSILQSGDTFFLEAQPAPTGGEIMEVYSPDKFHGDISSFDLLTWTQYSTSNYDGSIEVILTGPEDTAFVASSLPFNNGFHGPQLVELDPLQWTRISGAKSFAEVLSAIESVHFKIEAAAQNPESVRFTDIALLSEKCLVTPLSYIPVEPEDLHLVRFQEFVDLEIQSHQEDQISIAINPLTNGDEYYKLQWSPNLSSPESWRTTDIIVETCCEGDILPNQDNELFIQATRNGTMNIVVHFPAGTPPTAFFRAETQYYDFSALFEDE